MSVAVEHVAVASAPRPKGFQITPGRIGLYAFLIISALFFLIPLLIVFNTSLKPMDEIRAGDIFDLPIDPSFAAWAEAWTSACTGRNCEGIRVGFWNSVKILVPSVIFSILISAINGYALAQWRFKGSELILGALMLGAFIPYQVILYPMVRILSTVGLYGSLPGIIVVHIIFGLPVLTLIFRNFYSGIPIELIKAARIDGAGFFRIFFSIMLPMSTNILIVALILQVTGIWNDYLLGLIFAGRENLPMTVQLNNIVGSVTGERTFNVDMAATMLTALPPLIVYFLSGRYFVRGITAGAVKG
ncbi:MAG: carbohydrate ABC transporter permease [Pseudomonadota bacterium]